MSFRASVTGMAAALMVTAGAAVTDRDACAALAGDCALEFGKEARALRGEERHAGSPRGVATRAPSCARCSPG